jgi:SAM-dependent methyltransferase
MASDQGIPLETCRRAASEKETGTMEAQIDIEPELNDEPSPEWGYRFARLLESAWLNRKIDRYRRLREMNAYIRVHCPELLLGGDGLVVDVGPGPGEFLELARAMGFAILGIDAAKGAGGMGYEYLEACRLLTDRQKLPVLYDGFERWVFDDHSVINGTVALINFRGSIEQAFSRHMLGEPHDQHHNCRLLRWSMSAALREHMQVAFNQMARLLRPGGSILIAANGSANDEEYDSLIMAAAQLNGVLDLTMHKGATTHKWTKR